MTWTRFSEDGRLQRHTTSRNELDELRRTIERDLSDAEVELLSADRRFGIVFNAAVLLARMRWRATWTIAGSSATPSRTRPLAW